MERALILANFFNLLVAIYFLIIAIISLVHLRWYHQLTIAFRVRHIVTSATSYSAFVILLIESILLVVIFIATMSTYKTKRILSLEVKTTDQQPTNTTNLHRLELDQQQQQQQQQQGNTLVKQRLDSHSGKLSNYSNTNQSPTSRKTNPNETKSSVVCCSIFLQLISSILLIVILIMWLLNTGELVRESISAQLDVAFSKYQFANRSNHYSIAIDGMQDINDCCGSLDYTDFPHQRVSGLSSGHYPGSCCNKHIFGVNARVFCTPEEIIKAKQTAGCTTVLSNFYDLISLLIVPCALVSLFVSITIIALTTITRGFSLTGNQ